MEAKNNIIRRALEQAPGTQLPEGFCERLMERLERESARRERRETWLLGTAGVLCLLGGIAGRARGFLVEPGGGVHLPHKPSFPRMPLFPHIAAVTRPGALKFSQPGFPARNRRLSLFYVFIAATFLGLAGLDLYLRRRRHNAMKTNGHPHR